MLFEKAFRQTLKYYIYAERYINDGSPSGFTFINQVGKRYRPTSGYSNFKLPVFNIKKETAVLIGDINDILICNNLDSNAIPVPIHPDLLNGHDYLNPDFFVDVIPTASGRTVILDPDNVLGVQFIKLHYPKLIGRFNRYLPLFKWIAAKESMQAIHSFSNELPQNVTLFEDTVYLYIEKGFFPQEGFGVVFRNFPKKFNFNSGSIVIPIFSLFSNDIKSDSKKTILEKIIDDRALSKSDTIENILFPLIESYIFFATQIGIVPECNAQNIVLSIDQNSSLIIGYRDMEDFWKDISLRKDLKLNILFNDYHTINKECHDDYYKRRSFLYDFKLGEYILRPISELIAKKFRRNTVEIDSIIQEYGRQLWKNHEDYFFPYNTWYSYPKVTKVSRTYYQSHQNPKYR